MINKGDIYLLCANPVVVGVVTSIKDSKAEIFNISTTLGDKVKWYNKSLRYSCGENDFSPISDKIKLKLPKKQIKNTIRRIKYLTESIGDFRIN